VPFLRAHRVPVVVVHRSNHLDRLVCTIKDCLGGQDVPASVWRQVSGGLGVPRAANGTRSTTCIRRRVRTNELVRADIQLKSMAPLFGAWSREPSQQAVKLRTEQSAVVTYENLTQFEWAGSSGTQSTGDTVLSHVNTSIATWASVLTLWGITPNVASIMRGFGPEMGTKHSPPAHTKSIFNAKAVEMELTNIAKLRPTANYTALFRG
jgi:hypothetical protein